MPLYRCTRTFTSPTTWKSYCIGDIINQSVYDGLRYTERHNFQLDTTCEYTPPPSYTIPSFSNEIKSTINYEAK